MSAGVPGKHGPQLSTAADDAPTKGVVYVPLRKAFEALDEGGIAWALLRGAEFLARPQGDVEVLVDAAAEARIDTVLAAAGFVRIRAPGHGSHRFYVCYEPAHDRWIELDIVTEVAFGTRQELRTALAPALLARRRRLGDATELHPADAFWHSALHYLLSRGEVPAHRRQSLRSSVPEAVGAGPLETFVRELRGRVAARLPAAIAAADWGAVADLGRELRCAWYLRHGFGVVARSGLHALERRVPPGARRGVSVAVLGLDGAGKTTLAHALRSSTALPATYVYLGVWRDSRFEEQLRRIFGARLAVRLMTLLLKAVLIAGHRRRGRLVLLDRYTLDADLPSDSLDLKGRISAKLVRRTNAEPDLMLLLDGPVELMYARKGEHGVAELQVRRDAYLAMAKRLPQMVIIDAQQSRDEVRREATELIWERWSQRNGSTEKAAAARGATVTGARRAATERLPAGSAPSSRERT